MESSVNIGIKHIEYYLPEKRVFNDDFIDLGVDPGFLKDVLGIEVRHIAADDESVCDMAEKVCKSLFNCTKFEAYKIPLLVLCTQNPDYVLPTTACILQNAIGIPKSAMCFDINLGCSGYVYGLAIAGALMNAFGFHYSLVVTSEAYSKVISYEDKTTATLFSDSATATILERGCSISTFQDFDFGTDGSGYPNLIVPVSGSRAKRTDETKAMIDYGKGIRRSKEHLFMNGQEVMRFALSEVPKSINNILARNHLDVSTIDQFIFHQANKYMLNALKQRMLLPDDKVCIDLSFGNTVSSTLPIALKKMYSGVETTSDKTIILCGFGVGYSWASALLGIKPTFGELL